MIRVTCFSFVALLGLLHGLVVAQQPPHQDLAYDDDNPAQKLDVYLAETEEVLPVMVYIHGGGWRAGSKNRVPQWLVNGVEESQFNVVSVEYCFTDVAPHPAQTDDCMRAIQFVREHAEGWKIDPERIGVTGGSAGGHLSLWVALHDDIADENASDPVLQESSRVALAVGFAGPTDWNLLSELEHGHPAYRQLLGYEPGTPASEMKPELIKDVSPISFVSADDPPIMIVHGDADGLVPVKHARKLDQALEAAGVDSTLVIVEGGSHAVAVGGGEAAEKASSFVVEVFAKQ
jgi:acetyl esterase/lipase